jgi:ABC-type amino acid transport substrate-binding protein
VRINDEQNAKTLAPCGFIHRRRRLLFSAGQAAELLTEGVFKVGMEVTYPPFESYDSNNNIVGLDPEFAR